LRGGEDEATEKLTSREAEILQGLSQQGNWRPGGTQKSDSETLTVIVNSDTLAPQTVDGSFVVDGDSVTLTWNSVADVAYTVQFKEGNSAWAATERCSDWHRFFAHSDQ